MQGIVYIEEILANGSFDKASFAVGVRIRLVAQDVDVVAGVDEEDG